MPFFDGVSGQVYYRQWEAESPQAGIVFLHGFGEHSGLYHRFAHALNAAGIEVWALDQIGHGLSEGVRGDFGTLAGLADNAEQLTVIAEASRPGLPLVLAGHSLGSVVTALRVLDEPNRHVAAVLSGAPLSPVPWLDPNTLSESDGFELDPAILSSDPFYLDALENDPLSFVSGDAGALLAREFSLAWARFDRDLETTRVPLLAVHGELDQVAPIGGVRAWADRVPGLRLRELPGAQHDVLNESVHRLVASVIATFVLDRVEQVEGKVG